MLIFFVKFLNFQEIDLKKVKLKLNGIFGVKSQSFDLGLTFDQKVDQKVNLKVNYLTFWILN